MSVLLVLCKFLANAFICAVVFAGWTVLALLIVYYLAFALGPGPLFYVVVAETFSSHVREQALSLANFFLWTFNLVTVGTFPVLVKTGEGFTFAIFGAIGVACVLFVLWTVKETRGRSMVAGSNSASAFVKGQAGREAALSPTSQPEGGYAELMDDLDGFERAGPGSAERRSRDVTKRPRTRFAP